MYSRQGVVLQLGGLGEVLRIPPCKTALLRNIHMQYMTKQSGGKLLQHSDLREASPRIQREMKLGTWNLQKVGCGCVRVRVIVWDLETSTMRRPRPELSCWAKENWKLTNVINKQLQTFINKCISYNLNYFQGESDITSAKNSTPASNTSWL